MTERSREVDAFVGVGANLDPQGNLPGAMKELARRVAVVAASRFFLNPAIVPPGHRKLPDFVNGVVQIRTSLSPVLLKRDVLRSVEAFMGRERTEGKYAPRNLDLDLLVYGTPLTDPEGATLPDPDVFVHPHWAFPLCELIPMLPVPGGSGCLVDRTRQLDAGRLHYMARLTAEIRKQLGLS